MATNPKIKPCPRCGSEHVSVYSYESGWRYVECDGPGKPGDRGCWYSGPGEGSIRQAIKSHNEKCMPRREAPAHVADK